MIAETITIDFNIVARCLEKNEDWGKLLSFDVFGTENSNRFWKSKLISNICEECNKCKIETMCTSRYAIVWIYILAISVSYSFAFCVYKIRQKLSNYWHSIYNDKTTILMAEKYKSINMTALIVIIDYHRLYWCSNCDKYDTILWCPFCHACSNPVLFS